MNKQELASAHDQWVDTFKTNALRITGLTNHPDAEGAWAFCVKECKNNLNEALYLLEVIAGRISLAAAKEVPQ